MKSGDVRNVSRFFLLAAVLLCITPVISTCGGSGSTSTSNVGTTADRGAATGYVYVPAGSARQTGKVIMPGEAARSAAPAGYMPLEDATVSMSNISTTTKTDASGYYILTNLPTGSYTLNITKTGYSTITKPVSITAGQTTIATPALSADSAIALQTGGSIHVKSTPPGAAIFIDGYLTGMTTPQTLDKVLPGEHTISVSLNGYVASGGESVSVSSVSAASVWIIINPDTGGKTCIDGTMSLDGTCPNFRFYFSQHECSNPWGSAIQTSDEAQGIVNYYQSSHGIGIKEINLCPSYNLFYCPALCANAEGPDLSIVVDNEDAKKLIDENIFPEAGCGSIHGWTDPYSLYRNSDEEGNMPLHANPDSLNNNPSQCPLPPS